MLSYDACSTIIHALISCRLDYCNSILYNAPRSKTDRLQRLQNQCARILRKSSRREHITPVLKKLHWLKIQDRIIYKMLMLTYKSYYNIAPSYLCELINKKESHVNTRLHTDHHQLIMSPIRKDCSKTFLERSIIYAAPCEWNKLTEHQILIVSGRVLKQCYLHNTMDADCKQQYIYIIVMYVVITVNYCKCILLYWTLNKYYYYYYSPYTRIRWTL